MQKNNSFVLTLGLLSELVYGKKIFNDGVDIVADSRLKKEGVRLD